MATIHERIKELRKSQNLKQQELADMINVSMYTVSVWERGIRKPEYDNLDALCDVFNVNLGYLMGTNDDPTPVTQLSDEEAERFVEGSEKENLKHIFTTMSQLDEDSRQIIVAAIAQAYKICKQGNKLQAGYKVTVEDIE